MSKRRLITIFMALAFLFTLVSAAAAHPLGNFSTNRYSRLLVDTDQIQIKYVVDMAEIPTFQERQQMDLNGDEQISSDEEDAYLQAKMPLLAGSLLLVINNQPVTLVPQNAEMGFLPGQGDLPTLRLQMQLLTQLPAGITRPQVFYEDQNFAGRPGWREVVVQPTDTIQLLSSTVSANDISNALQDYPDDALQNPPAVSQAEFVFATAVSPPPPTSRQNPVSTAAPDRFSQDEFANLLATTLDHPEAIVLALIIAFGLGATHALTPGHGKTIVGAYLVGSRGTAKHALFLGIITTVTHTAGVFGFGLLIFFASQFILPEQLYPWLGVISGLLVVIIGFSLTRNHVRSLRPQPDVDHSQIKGYHIHFGIGHLHTPTIEKPGWRNLLALGVSGGLLPCPSALVLLLSAIALQKIGLGLVLIVVFSIGLAAVLTGIGLALVYAGRLFDKLALPQSRVTRLLPVASAMFITIAGAVITVRALVATGVLAL